MWNTPGDFASPDTIFIKLIHFKLFRFISLYAIKFNRITHIDDGRICHNNKL